MTLAVDGNLGQVCKRVGGIGPRLAVDVGPVQHRVGGVLDGPARERVVESIEDSRQVLLGPKKKRSIVSLISVLLAASRFIDATQSLPTAMQKLLRHWGPSQTTWFGPSVRLEIEPWRHLFLINPRLGRLQGADLPPGVSDRPSH